MGGFLIHFSQLLTAGLFKQSLTVVNHLQLCGRTFHLNIYFCLQSQEGRKLTLERTFISLNRSSYTEKTNWFPCPRGNNQPLWLPLSMFFSASYFPLTSLTVHWSNVQWNVHIIANLHWIFFTKLYHWSKKIAPSPILNEAKLSEAKKVETCNWSRAFPRLNWG